MRKAQKKQGKTQHCPGKGKLEEGWWYCHQPQNTGRDESRDEVPVPYYHPNHISKNGLPAIYELAGPLLAMINGKQLIPFPFQPLIKHLRQMRVSFCKDMAVNNLTAFSPSGLEILSTMLRGNLKI